MSGPKPPACEPVENNGMTKKSRRISHKGIDYVAPMLY